MLVKLASICVLNKQHTCLNVCIYNSSVLNGCSITIIYEDVLENSALFVNSSATLIVIDFMTVLYYIYRHIS